MSDFTQKLIEKWLNDETLQFGVPYRRMASDAEELHAAELAAMRDRLARQERVVEAAREYMKAVNDNSVNYSERLNKYEALAAALKDLEP
jgi:hypothetical protein